ELFHVDAAEQLLDRFGAHLRDEDVAELAAQLTVLLFRKELFLGKSGFEIDRIDDDVRLEIEDALEIAERNIEQMSDARRQSLEEPHVRNGRGQLDVTHALAANLRLGDLDATFVADDAAMLHALVLAAEAFPVGDRTEDLRAEETVALGLESTVVDRFRLGDFAVINRP